MKFLEILKSIATSEITSSILFFVVFCTIIYLLYRYKKEFLFKMALIYTQQAEDYFGSKAGQEKLAYVCGKIREKTPWYIDILISETLLLKVINQVVSMLQSTFESSKEKQIKAVNTVIKLTSENDNNIDFAGEKVLSEIDQKGFVEGYAEVKSDLKDNTEVRVGVKAGMKL